MGSDGFVDGLMVYQMGERGRGRDRREGGREGGKEGEVEVPHLLATLSNVLDQITAGSSIQIGHFHTYYCIIQIPPKLNSKQMLPVLASPVHLPCRTFSSGQRTLRELCNRHIFRHIDIVAHCLIRRAVRALARPA